MVSVLIELFESDDDSFEFASSGQLENLAKIDSAFEAVSMKPATPLR